jgi:hypothetical protein
MKAIKKQYLVVGLIVVALGIIFLLAGYVVPRVLVSLTKAAPVNKVSLSSSKVLGETILARADGKDTCVVNVFIMDASGKGIPGRRVALAGVDNITPLSAVTDDSGKAGFSMVSTVENQYVISASVDGVQMPMTVKVTFRNQI